MSIQLGREAVSLCPEGHADRDHYLDNLAFSLSSRFDHQGKANDLDEAIFWHEEALCLRPGTALVARFNTRSDIDDITRAISLHREALTLCPPGHLHHDTTLNNLALALQTRYDKSHVRRDLNEAIDQSRESLRLTRLDHPERHITLFNLSSVLCSRFTQTQKIEDVEEAITLCQQSLEALHSLHPDRHYSYLRLQEAYMSRYCVQHKPGDLALAVENFRLASRHPTHGFPNRIIQAHKWAVAAEQHGDGSALEAYSTFFRASGCSFGNTIVGNFTAGKLPAAFHYARSLPVDAASGAIRRNNLPRAVELWSRAVDSSGRWHLDSGPQSKNEVLQTVTDRAAADWEATEYRILTRQWEAAVAEIRDLPAFLAVPASPPSYEDLQVAARQGPVIILMRANTRQRHHRPAV
ncbi:uncharacterized protein F5891DRAFT_1281943 [Suillus fuscotomentosus]|uniref:Uncharacterized protein n=1 Tax=Suillus fuscotomentosus TaxID=1912939 RepID=A0AAD4HDL8_9AGAM|nr:uncharacterized protein F5891DRAFT_1281943 [Suillus fuscotomentosus]KAG1893730.1 hypothetical protein F5891DRAFT_1281943 [Suillus fuscotomentosus]